MKLLYTLLLALLLSACGTGNNRALPPHNFSITNDSGLFFKNVRQLYYDFQEIPPGSNRYVYRIKSRNHSDRSPLIYPTLMIDWVKEEASILIEPNNYPGIPILLNIKIDCSEKAEVSYAVLDERGKENMLDFALKIYQAIEQGCILSLEIEQEFIPIMQDDMSKEAFRKAMLDYFALVRISPKLNKKK